MKQQRVEVLPTSLPPIGINREQAAALIGISTSLFDRAVLAGTMPRPRMIGERQVYDVTEIAEAFRRLPHKGTGQPDLDGIAADNNPWD